MDVPLPSGRGRGPEQAATWVTFIAVGPRHLLLAGLPAHLILYFDEGTAMARDIGGEHADRQRA